MKKKTSAHLQRKWKNNGSRSKPKHCRGVNVKSRKIQKSKNAVIYKKNVASNVRVNLTQKSSSPILDKRRHYKESSCAMSPSSASKLLFSPFDEQMSESECESEPDVSFSNDSPSIRIGCNEQAGTYASISQIQESPSRSNSAASNTFSNQETSDEASVESEEENKLESDSEDVQDCIEDDPEILLENEDSKIFTFTCPETHRAVLVLHHPVSATIEGCVSLRVLSGSVAVFGCNLSSSIKKFVPLYSSNTFGYLQLETTSSVNIWKEDTWKDVNKELENLTSKEVAKSALQASQNVGVIIVLKNCYTSALVFATSYIPSVFSSCLQNSKNVACKSYSFNISPDNNGAIIMDSKVHLMTNKIISEICNAKMSGERMPCILVTGPKGSGKSTLIRYMLNRYLNMFSEAYYLDGDPGQTEFTPPGCLSLTEVKEYVLGPPFTHLRTPKKAIFFGAVVVESVELYNSTIQELVSFYKKYSHEAPLFVNTMGFLTGIGADCLQSIISYVEPTITIELVKERQANYYNSTFSTDLKGKMVCKVVKQHLHNHKNKLDARTRRELAMLTYLGLCQPRFERVKQLHCFQSHCVSWLDIAIHVTNENTSLDLILLSVNASLVALCVVNEEHMMMVKDDVRPKVITKNAVHECLGFGVVRGIDPRKKLLYIITPLSKTILHRVNAIIKGNVNLPEVVFLKQNIVGVHIPYVRQKIES